MARYHSPLLSLPHATRLTRPTHDRMTCLSHPTFQGSLSRAITGSYGAYQPYQDTTHPPLIHFRPQIVVTGEVLHPLNYATHSPTRIRNDQAVTSVQIKSRTCPGSDQSTSTGTITASTSPSSTQSSLGTWHTSPPPTAPPFRSPPAQAGPHVCCPSPSFPPPHFHPSCSLVVADGDEDRPWVFARTWVPAKLQAKVTLRPAAWQLRCDKRFV